MNVIENVDRLSDQELFNELKKRGVNVGPISPTTRDLYKKKLTKILIETKTGSKNSPTGLTSDSGIVSKDLIQSYTDEELFRALKDRGLTPGPILPSTRHLYEKKLLDQIKRSKIPGYPDKECSNSASPKEPEKNKFFANTSFAESTANIFPSLDFKLLKNDPKSDQNCVNNNYNNNNNNNNEDSFMKKNNFEKSLKFSDPYSKILHPNEKNNGSYLDYVQPKIQPTRKNLISRLNLDTDRVNDRYTNFNNTYNANNLNSSYRNLYDEPPPPQPNQSYNSKHEPKFSIHQFILENYKIIIITICILIILSLTFSSSNNNHFEF